MSYRFTVVKKGYNPEEVDSFIQGLESALKNYKEKEVAIKNAFINAQVAADKIIQDAKEDVAEMKRNTLYQLEMIKKAVEEQKQVLSSFQEDYNRLIRKYLQDVSTSEFELLMSKIDSLTGSMQTLIQAAEQESMDAFRPDLMSTKVYDKAEIQHMQERMDLKRAKEEKMEEITAAEAQKEKQTEPPAKMIDKPMETPPEPEETPPLAKVEEKEELPPSTVKPLITPEENEALRGLFK